jgi:all-trans-8'-apo-beta-carotenal 15,15'-oxygenase
VSIPEPTDPPCHSAPRPAYVRIARYEFPSLGDLPSSPAFAPRRAGADPTRSRHAGPDPGGHDGYVVCPVLSDDGFRVELFDAGDPGRGPVATLAAPGAATVPLLLHASWAPAATNAPDRERLTFADDIADDTAGDRLDALPDRAAAAVRSVIAGLDA